MLHRCTAPCVAWRQAWLQRQLLPVHWLSNAAVLRKLPSWVQCFGTAPKPAAFILQPQDKEQWAALPESAQVWVLPSPQCQAMKNLQGPAAKPSSFSATAFNTPSLEHPTPSAGLANRKLTTPGSLIAQALVGFQSHSHSIPQKVSFFYTHFGRELLI